MIIDHYFVALAPGVKGDERDIGEGIFADQKIFAGHLLVQGLEMLLHLVLGFVQVSIVLQIAGRGMDACVHEIDPDTRLGAQERIARHQPNLRKLFFQIFVENGRFVNHAVAVDQHGHFAVGILPDEIFRLVLKIDFDQFASELFFRKDNPCPVGVGSSMCGVEFHRLVSL